MNYKLILLITTFLCTACYSQKLKIKYSYLPNEAKEDSFYFKISKPISSLTISGNENFNVSKKLYKKDIFSETTIELDVKDTSICFFLDGFGHESFVIPNDSLIISLKKLEKVNGKFILPSGYASSWLNDFSYEGKNKFIYALFDSLAYHSGSVFIDYLNVSKFKFDVSNFFDSATAKYQNRVNYINYYANKFNIPINIKNLTLSEVKSAYIKCLLDLFLYSSKYVNFKELPEKYIDVLEGVSFKDPYYFFRTSLYSSTALSYYNLFKIKYLKNIQDNEILFRNTYILIREETNYQIKNYLLASLLLDNIKNNYSSFNALFTYYKKEFSKSNYIKEIDSLIGVNNNIVKPNLEAALHCLLKDSLKVSKNIVEILKAKKPIIIDCWASWCKPCISQMPFSFEFEKEYGEKIDFIYLSFDRNEKDWLNKQSSLKIKTNSYILDKNFQSDFAKYFSISSIPRYIALDKYGNVLYDNTPQPANKIEFRKLLNSLLDK